MKLIELGDPAKGLFGRSVEDSSELLSENFRAINVSSLYAAGSPIAGEVPQVLLVASWSSSLWGKFGESSGHGKELLQG